MISIPNVDSTGKKIAVFIGVVVTVIFLLGAYNQFVLTPDVSPDGMSRNHVNEKVLISEYNSFLESNYYKLEEKRTVETGDRTRTVRREYYKTEDGFHYKEIHIQGNTYDTVREEFITENETHVMYRNKTNTSFETIDGYSTLEHVRISEASLSEISLEPVVHSGETPEFYVTGESVKGQPEDLKTIFGINKIKNIDFKAEIMLNNSVQIHRLQIVGEDFGGNNKTITYSSNIFSSESPYRKPTWIKRPTNNSSS